MSTVVDSSQSGGSQEKQQQRRQQEEQRALTRVQILQKLIQHAPDLPRFLHELIYNQAVTVAGTEAAAFLIKPGEQAGFLLDLVDHIRPDDTSPDVREAAVNAFKEIVRPCVEQNKDGAIEVDAADASGEIQYCLVTLLPGDDGRPIGATAVITRARDLQRAQQRLESMRLVAGYFQFFSMRRKLEGAVMQSKTHQDVLQFASAFSTADGFTGAAMALCNEIATRTGAARVSIGWRKWKLDGANHVRLSAMSHTENFDRKQELSVMIEKVMDECADQEAPVHYEMDGTGSDNISRMAQQLSRMEGGHTVASFPLRKGGEVKGVMTLEFAPGTKLNPGALSGMTVAAELLSPQLHDRYENDRWWITKTGISTINLGKMIVGPKHRLGVLITLLIIGALLFVSMYKPMYRVSAPFQFVTMERRILSAPFEGQLATVLVRPGDPVKAGQVLATMRTDDLVLQAVAQEREAEGKYKDAARLRGEGKIAESVASNELGNAAAARGQYYRGQVAKANIVAPIDGEVLTGDLLAKQGTSVKLGEELFTVGTNNREKLEVEVLVHERDIQDVKYAQANDMSGWIATTSRPDEKVEFKIRRVVPQPEAKDNKNVFKVYGTITGAGSAQWVQGMAGEASIDVRPAPLIWQWTHRFVDWVKMKAWIWL